MESKNRNEKSGSKTMSTQSLDGAIPLEVDTSATKFVSKRFEQVDRALEICMKVIKSNDKSQHEFYLGCRDALTLYRGELEKAEDKVDQKYWAEKIDSTLEKMYEKDSQNKKFILGGLSIVVFGAVVISYIRKIARV